MIEDHVKYTNSIRGKEILNDFEEYLPRYSGSSPDCPTAFYFVSESFGSEAFLGKLVAIHTCPESCPE